MRMAGDLCNQNQPSYHHSSEFIRMSRLVFLSSMDGVSSRERVRDPLSTPTACQGKWHKVCKCVVHLGPSCLKTDVSTHFH